MDERLHELCWRPTPAPESNKRCSTEKQNEAKRGKPRAVAQGIRQQQAERIKTWKPWAKSTGPKSPEGKATASRNAWRGGTRQVLRGLSRASGEQRELLDTL